jgi:mannose-6-phosphate isomerase-like protein (cupin superfamily)
MATILLDVEESFEHLHRQASLTVLKEGRARLVMNGSVLELQPNVAVTVPANTSHTIVNIGETTAVVNCVH